MLLTVSQKWNLCCHTKYIKHCVYRFLAYSNRETLDGNGRAKEWKSLKGRCKNGNEKVQEDISWFRGQNDFGKVWWKGDLRGIIFFIFFSKDYISFFCRGGQTSIIMNFASWWIIWNVEGTLSQLLQHVRLILKNVTSPSEIWIYGYFDSIELITHKFLLFFALL